jgi:hypothetical protein
MRGAHIRTGPILGEFILLISRVAKGTIRFFVFNLKKKQPKLVGRFFVANLDCHHKPFGTYYLPTVCAPSARTFNFTCDFFLSLELSLVRFALIALRVHLGVEGPEAKGSRTGCLEAMIDAVVMATASSSWQRK